MRSKSVEMGAAREAAHRRPDLPNAAAHCGSGQGFRANEVLSEWVTTRGEGPFRGPLPRAA